MARQIKATQAAIIWGGTWEALTEGRKILPSAVHSDLRFFDADSAEFAPQVAILKGHPKSEACETFYRKRGAHVSLFELPKEEVKEEAPKAAKTKS